MLFKELFTRLCTGALSSALVFCVNPACPEIKTTSVEKVSTLYAGQATAGSVTTNTIKKIKKKTQTGIEASYKNTTKDRYSSIDQKFVSVYPVYTIEYEDGEIVKDQVDKTTQISADDLDIDYGILFRRGENEFYAKQLSTGFEDTFIVLGADIVKKELNSMSELYLEKRAEYPFLSKGISALHDKYDAEMEEERARITVYKTCNDAEVLMLLDYLWNKGIKDKKNGISNWIFIDDADDVLRTVEGTEYFIKYLSDSSDMQTITTFVIKDSLSLFNNLTKTTYLENAVNACGYVKLLNQGPIERKKFEEILNIPSALIPYVSSVSPGKGLIITPQSNIAFNDNFTEVYPDSSFKDIFYIPVKQRIRD